MWSNNKAFCNNSPLNHGEGGLWSTQTIASVCTTIVMKIRISRKAFLRLQAYIENEWLMHAHGGETRWHVLFSACLRPGTSVGTIYAGQILHYRNGLCKRPNISPQTFHVGESKPGRGRTTDGLPKATVRRPDHALPVVLRHKTYTNRSVTVCETVDRPHGSMKVV